MALFDNPTSPPTSGHEMARQKVDAAGNLSGSDFSAGMGIKVNSENTVPSASWRRQKKGKSQELQFSRLLHESNATEHIAGHPIVS